MNCKCMYACFVVHCLCLSYGGYSGVPMSVQKIFVLEVTQIANYRLRVEKKKMLHSVNFTAFCYTARNTNDSFESAVYIL